jgi:hypothetical protein
MKNIDFEKNENGIVINKNMEEYRKYTMLREKGVREIQLLKRIDNLESEVKKLKDLLRNHLTG